jgi:hypothetical protein
VNETELTQPTKNEQEPIRGSLLDWKGGKPVNLDKTLPSGKTVREELATHIKDELEQELKNHEELVGKLKKWHKIYKGHKERKNYPWPGCANLSIPMTRSDVDAIYVRIMDMVFSKRRLALFSPKGEVQPDERDQIHKWEAAFNSYLINDLHLKEKMAFPTLQAVKTGTGLVKIVYETNSKPIMRYAKEEEVGDTSVSKYKLPGTDSVAVKEHYIAFQGPNVYPISRENWIISSDAMTIEDAYFTAFRFYLRKSELKVRAAKGIYDKEAVSKVRPGEYTDIEKERAKSHGTELKPTKYSEPYELFDCWLGYDVDGDGDEDDIEVIFHRESGQILKAIYNPIFYTYRPFVDFKGSQIEYTYDGEGICEILESIQEELDTLHNLRLDRLKQINLPITLVRSGTNLKDFNLEPGKVHEVDEDLEAAIKFVQFPDVYFSLDREEDRLISQGDRAIGITPNVLGMSTSERPVAKETYANIEEANKKFKSWADNFRIGYSELFYKLLECFAQYQPQYTYTDEGGVAQTVTFPTGNIRDYLKIDLEVSSEQMNLEIRREVELMKYQLFKDYITGMVGLAQQATNPMAPSDFKTILFKLSEIGSKMFVRVMENFEEVEPSTLNVDINKFVDANKLIQNSPDLKQLPPPGGMPGVPGAPPQGAMMGGPPPGGMAPGIPTGGMA